MNEIITIDGVNYRKIARKATIGDRILIVAENGSFGKYSNGDTFRVEGVSIAGVLISSVSAPHNQNGFISDNEYVVLESVSYERPPLGLKPRYIHEEERLVDVRSAISRCLDGKSPIPYEWLTEYHDLLKGAK